MHERTIKIERIMKASAERIWRCWCEPKLFEQWYCPKPVSYTHLDVYKRQHYEGGIDIRPVIALTFAGLCFCYVTTVSYTHLDVYKRQIITNERADKNAIFIKCIFNFYQKSR